MRGGRMIKLSDYPIFSENLSTLKETSVDKRDSNNYIYMTESNRPVVSFDLVKEKYTENLGLSSVPKSNDALFDDENGKLIFVEFKNGYIDSKKQFDIRKKIYDSTLIFSDIVSVGISNLRQCMEYVLVYNESANATNPDISDKKANYVQESTSFDKFAKTISGLAKDEYVGFGVKMFENYCFKKVHTYTESEFEKYLATL